jgi:hypothetical protein
MIIRGLNSSHDWEWGSGLANYLTNDAAIAENIDTRLLSWVGDCYFDLAAGIDWLNLLGSLGQEGTLDLNLRRVILQSYGVTGLVSLSVTLNSARLFQAEYVINTIFSQNYQNTLTQDLGNPQ